MCLLACQPTSHSQLPPGPDGCDDQPRSLATCKLTRSLREPAGHCTKSMEVSESRMERVKRELTGQDLSCMPYSTVHMR